ncbi:MAG: CRISPR-associated endonuclease Cas2 [Bacteroidales bacterium]|nr:CRISPR-associated endonuclease Cas2 [Bacteroidales bacterium]
MIYLLFYDISSNRLRNKIAKLLISNGFERLQLSVFTGLANPIMNKYLWQMILKILEAEPDSKLFVLPVMKSHFCTMQGIGVEELDLEYLAGVRSSLTF